MRLQHLLILNLTFRKDETQTHVRKLHIQGQIACPSDLSPLLPSSVAVKKLHSVSVPQFPHL